MTGSAIEILLQGLRHLLAVLVLDLGIGIGIGDHLGVGVARVSLHRLDVTLMSAWDYVRPDGFCKVKWFDSMDSYVANVIFTSEPELMGGVVDDDGTIQPDFDS